MAYFSQIPPSIAGCLGIKLRTEALREIGYLISVSRLKNTSTPGFKLLAPRIRRAVTAGYAMAYPAVTARLIRGARSLNPGVEVFFKRDTEIKYPISRKASVLNFMPKQPAIDGGI